MSLNINGRMKVKTLKSDFKNEFGLTIRVYDGRSFADDTATLASIRKGESKGGEFSPKRNTKVGNLEEKIMELFGLKTQVAGSDDSYLCDNDHTLAKALEVDGALMDKRSSKKLDVKEKKSTIKPTEGTSQTAMSITDIIKEIKNIYSDHELLERMVSDLESEYDYNFWADQLCTEDFNNNIKLGKSLYKISAENAEDFDDYVSLAEGIAESNGLNDKAWSKELYQTALEIAEDGDELYQLGESIINEDYLNDKDWAKEVFNLALEKTDDIYIFRGIGTANSEIDTDLSRKAFQKALDVASNDQEYETIADEIEKFLNDSQWAQEIREMKGA